MTALPGFAPTDTLDGKVAVIAGGTGAIGAATARRLARRGARVVLLHRGHAAVAQPVLDSLEGGGHGAVTASVTDSAALREATRSVMASHGRCDILVNSAGHTRPVPAADLDALTDDLIDEMMVANFRAVIATMRAFVPMLQAHGDGLVVNVSSISAFTGQGSNLAYVAAKAGVDVVGDALARALAPRVRVVSVSPGAVESGFVPGRGAEFSSKMAGSTPLGRIGLPDDVAAAVEACATLLRFATGTRFVVDGGRHL